MVDIKQIKMDLDNNVIVCSATIRALVEEVYRERTTVEHVAHVSRDAMGMYDIEMDVGFEKLPEGTLLYINPIIHIYSGRQADGSWVHTEDRAIYLPDIQPLVWDKGETK